MKIQNSSSGSIPPSSSRVAPSGKKCDQFLSFGGLWVFMQRARPLLLAFSGPEWDVDVIVRPYLVVNHSS